MILLRPVHFLCLASRLPARHQPPARCPMPLVVLVRLPFLLLGAPLCAQAPIIRRHSLIRGFPILGNNIRFEYTCHVNARDHGYQKAYRRFRARLAQARRHAGLTQVQVAKRLGRPHSYISKCELGERRVDVIELRQLAKLYRKSMSFFWT